MSEHDIQMQTRVNTKKRDKFTKVAKSLGMSRSDYLRVMMDAAIDGTLRIVTTEKTTTVIKGVHINV
jgi:hypothetical protein